MKKEVTFSILLVAALLVVILIDRKVEQNKTKEFGVDKTLMAKSAPMTITSGDFKESEYIPARFTCDGENIHPSLQFNSVPEDAVALALIVEDPDISKEFKPDGIWDHWVVFDIPKGTTNISAGETVEGTYGKNSKGDVVYTGPCPPDKTHRYFFRLYALDAKIGLPAGSSKSDVLAAMSGHILRQSSLIGMYNRTAPKPEENVGTDVVKTPTL